VLSGDVDCIGNSAPARMAPEIARASSTNKKAD